MKLFEKYSYLFLVCFFSFIGGYILSQYHESQYRDKASEKLYQLEQEFHDSIESQREFLIFNGQFKVWPVRNYKNRFHYRERK